MYIHFILSKFFAGTQFLQMVLVTLRDLQGHF